MPYKYSDEFKADAVALFERYPELSYVQAAEDLGVSLSALKVWVQPGPQKVREAAHTSSWGIGGDT